MTQPTDHVTALARRLRMDIDVATYPAVDWQRLYGIEEIKPVDELRTEGDETIEDQGSMREAVTGYNTRWEIKLIHRTATDGITWNTVQAFLKAKFEASKVSTLSGEFGVRVYDRDGRDDAKQARAYVKAWNPDGGGGGARDTISLVIQSQGPVSLVTNPLAGTVPAVTMLSPITGPTAGGTAVLIKGSKFTGVTGAAGVKFGANNATSYTFVDDSTIVAVAPAGTAGAKDVTVTTPGGTSPTAGTGNDYTYV
jgi:hypothetical protein